MGPNEADLSTRRSSRSQGAAQLVPSIPISPLKPPPDSATKSDPSTSHPNSHTTLLLLLGLEGPVVCGSTMARKGGESQD